MTEVLGNTVIFRYLYPNPRDKPKYIVKLNFLVKISQILSQYQVHLINGIILKIYWLIEVMVCMNFP